MTPADAVPGPVSRAAPDAAITEPAISEPGVAERDRYSASYFVGGLDRLVIFKQGRLGCFQLVLIGTAGPSRSEVVVEAQPGDELVFQEGFQRPCGTRGAVTLASRATGTITVGGCSVDLDVTLELRGETTRRVERLVASGVVVDGRCVPRSARGPLRPHIETLRAPSST